MSGPLFVFLVLLLAHVKSDVDMEVYRKSPESIGTVKKEGGECKTDNDCGFFMYCYNTKLKKLSQLKEKETDEEYEKKAPAIRAQKESLKCSTEIESCCMGHHDHYSLTEDTFTIDKNIKEACPTVKPMLREKQGDAKEAWKLFESALTATPAREAILKKRCRIQDKLTAEEEAIVKKFDPTGTPPTPDTDPAGTEITIDGLLVKLKAVQCATNSKADSDKSNTPKDCLETKKCQLGGPDLPMCMKCDEVVTGYDKENTLTDVRYCKDKPKRTGKVVDLQPANTKGGKPTENKKVFVGSSATNILNPHIRGGLGVVSLLLFLSAIGYATSQCKATGDSYTALLDLEEVE